MRFHRLDLNLIVALEALLTERNVSQAAARICLSQSATSNALNRLREYFGDELMVLKGRQMFLTPRALELVEPVKYVLEQIRTTITTAPKFEPEHCDRVIRIMASDYAIEVLLGPVLAELSRQAPKLRFAIAPFQEDLNEALDRGAVDLILSVDILLARDHPSRLLFEDDFVVAAWIGNKRIGGALDREQFFSLGHIGIEFSRGQQLDYFQFNGLARRIEVVAPHFTAIPALLVGSDRLAIMQRRLAERSAASAPIQILRSPFEIPPLRQAAQWHRSSDSDPALQWLVDRLASAAAQPHVDAVVSPPAQLTYPFAP